MATRPSRAAAFFQEIMTHPGHADTLAFLRSLVNATPPRDETEYLDFKSASVGASEIPEKDMKKAWSEAVAGFATTSGGVLIWGIDARKPPGGDIDQACGFKLVLNPEDFKARLKQLLLNASDPPVPNIQIEAFPHPADGGKGFVVCYIPESAYKPHRADMGGKRWVMRISDNFVDIPASVLRSLFFPNRHSYVFMRMTLRVQNTSDQLGPITKVTFLPRIYNEGPATVEDLFILMKPIDKLYLDIPIAWAGGHTSIGWEVKYPDPIHPGQMVEFCNPVIDRRAHSDGKPNLEGFDPNFEFQMYASDQVPFRILIPFSSDELKAGAMKVGLPEPIEIDRYR